MVNVIRYAIQVFRKHLVWRRPHSTHCSSSFHLFHPLDQPKVCLEDTNVVCLRWVLVKIESSSRTDRSIKNFISHTRVFSLVQIYPLSLLYLGHLIYLGHSTISNVTSINKPGSWWPGILCVATEILPPQSKFHALGLIIYPDLYTIEIRLANPTLILVLNARRKAIYLWLGRNEI